MLSRFADDPAKAATVGSTPCRDRVKDRFSILPIDPPLVLTGQCVSRSRAQHTLRSLGTLKIPCSPFDGRMLDGRWTQITLSRSRIIKNNDCACSLWKKKEGGTSFRSYSLLCLVIASLFCLEFGEFSVRTLLFRPCKPISFFYTELQNKRSYSAVQV